MEGSSQHRVVCFGEVLWDILPTGAVPGGAPMNVAYHLHKLGKMPALITRVGRDERGSELIKIFSSHGVQTGFFQVDDEHETGKVFAHPGKDNEMTYEIVMPVAWDYIAWKDEYAHLASKADFFVFGSLAARNDISKKTLLQLLEAASKKVLDINLRSPHFNRPLLEELLHKADLLKLNQAELELIAGWFGSNTDINESVQRIMDKFSIDTIVVTMGGNGALLFMNGQMYRHNGFRVQVADTVGSGDAFLAALLSKLLDGAGPAASLEYASALGAFIASQTGACPDYMLKDVDATILAKSLI